MPIKQWSDLNESQQFQAAQEAERFGGSFARNIAAAWFVADSSNRAKLVAAFGDLLVKYAPSEAPAAVAAAAGKAIEAAYPMGYRSKESAP